MKKVLISVMGVLFGVVLVGCGGGSTPADDTPALAPTENTADQPTDDVVVGNEGEVVIDEVYTAKLGQCLTDNGVTMFGTERCGHCKTQKAAFGEGFENVTYVDCDADRQSCLDNGVRGFPTWIDAEGNPYPGTQTLPRLAAIAGCDDIE